MHLALVLLAIVVVTEAIPPYAQRSQDGHAILHTF
jgi:hypothetical protein